ncbi:hypothetical protein AL952_001030 [Salmonella enterica subsp. arizonae]|nr:hypothetical protein [Salmonella enterica subsp. arizonae]
MRAIQTLNRGSAQVNKSELSCGLVIKHTFALYFIVNRGKIRPLQHILEYSHIL